VASKPASHRYDPLTKQCYGCRASAGLVAQGKRSAECPAIYGEIGSSGARFVMTAAESLIVFPSPTEAYAVRFDKAEVWDLRDAIEQSVRILRDRK
jgi:hypothetical protein